MFGNGQGMRLFVFASAVFFFATIVSIKTAEEDSESLTDEELLYRQQVEFVDPLGYGDNGTPDEIIQTLKDGEEDAKKGRVVRRERRKATMRSPNSVASKLSNVVEMDISDFNIPGISVLNNQVSITTFEVKVTENLMTNFSVDSTVTTIQIRVTTTCCKPRFQLTDPAGHIVTTSDKNVTQNNVSNTSYILQIVSPMVGQWNILITDSTGQKYSVQILGDSTTDFDSTFVNNMGFDVPGQPLPNDNSTYLEIKPDGAVSNNWTCLVVKDVNGTSLQYIPMGQPKGSRTERAFLVKVVWPNQDVHVAAEGTDKYGNIFTREQPTLVQPIGIRVVSNQSGSDLLTTCNAFTIPFTVTNTGQGTNITVTVRLDDQKFQPNVSDTEFYLDKNNNRSLSVTLLPLANLITGESVYISIGATTPDGRSQYLQQIFVVSKDLPCKPFSARSPALCSYAPILAVSFVARFL